MIRSAQSGYRKLIGGPAAYAVNAYKPRLTGGDMADSNYPQNAGKGKRGLLSGLLAVYVTRLVSCVLVHKAQLMRKAYHINQGL